MKYQLQLETGHGRDRYIITGDEWLERIPWGGEFSGVAIIYPEHDLLWLGLPVAESERFGSLKNFEKEFNSLPRWEATRYAVLEGMMKIVGSHHTHGAALFLFDCRTGEQLIEGCTGKIAPGWEAEVERLRHIIEPMMGGEQFRFL